MSVFTKVTPEELSLWLRSYPLGTLVELKGIAEGIENTNYFVTTSQGRYVLTLFERLSAAELPFYVNLMSHLAHLGIPCPAPIADCNGALFGVLNDKPATLVTRLPGRPVTDPGAQHCAHLGSVLAKMHQAALGYAGSLENTRGLSWWRETAPKVMPFLDAPRQALLNAELEDQLLQDPRGLPRGPVHADLFRDNVLWENDNTLGGVIDFYFAGVDTLLFDVAVTVNDWCITPDGEIEPQRYAALISAYRAVREFNAAERAAWTWMLRAAALRFWLSRLFDFYLPRKGELTHAHDPEHFCRILKARRAHTPVLD
jgi:homoserine kinase type II